jgi:hypothetical protein
MGLGGVYPRILAHYFRLRNILFDQDGQYSVKFILAKSWLWLLIAIGLTACSSGQAKAPDLRVVGALDVLPLIVGNQQGFFEYSGLEIAAAPSTDGIKELLDGKADSVILGREPTPQEQEGLTVIPIAYDAVCFLINTRTFEGGTQVNPTGKVIEYQKRTSGLQELSLLEIKSHLKNIYQPSMERWLWEGDYEEFNATKDIHSRLVNDPRNLGYSHGKWMHIPTYIFGEATQEGKFDTQGYLLQMMGWGNDVLETPDIGFIPSIFESEEEVISFRFLLAPTNQNPENSSAFYFYLLPVSRRVTIRAIKEGFALRPIRIDGEDCAEDPSDIYDGKYPLGRRVYLLAKRPLSPDLRRLVEYIFSPEGQARIGELDFLPLPPDLNKP